MERLKISQGKGKMFGFYSINTDSTSNHFCQAMQGKEGTVCQACYACRMLSYRSAAMACFGRNQAILTSKNPRLPSDLSGIIRLHSFGEIVNRQHQANFERLAELNPRASFTQWTKRPRLCRPGKVKNLRLIYSEPKIDKLDGKAPKGFHGRFVVVSKGKGEESAKKLGATLCAGKACRECMVCYTSKPGFTIVEEVK